MCDDKKNNRLEVVLDIRTGVLRLVVDSARGTVRLCAPLDSHADPKVGYTINGRCCA